VDVVLDDRLLIEELLVGLDRRRRHVQLFTTTYWYYRACRAAMAGGGGHLSGPFRELSEEAQQRAIASMLELPETIGLAAPRAVLPLMVQVAGRHPPLNVLNVEAVATALHLGATVWLSPKGSQGLLAGVLDTEGVAWDTVTQT